MRDTGSAFLKAILVWTFIIGLFVGFVLNIYKFAGCDFEDPYKTEIIRGIGIPVFILGAVVGYLDIGEENTE